ncbi:MAG: hypothetical protein H0U59_11110 [Gemmatimonadaceae bacterium]|nr:hypothetical protein [Gemmatimonadaceae bacterium]
MMRPATKLLADLSAIIAASRELSSAIDAVSGDGQWTDFMGEMGRLIEENQRLNKINKKMLDAKLGPEGLGIDQAAQWLRGHGYSVMRLL